MPFKKTTLQFAVQKEINYAVMKLVFIYKNIYL